MGRFFFAISFVKIEHSLNIGYLKKLKLHFLDQIVDFTYEQIGCSPW
jgi:hypothetical protein